MNIIEEMEAIAKSRKDNEIVYIFVPNRYSRELSLIGTGFFFAMPHEKHYDGTFHGCYVKFDKSDSINIERREF